MKSKRGLFLLGVSLVLGMGTAGCGGCSKHRLTGGGSSFVEPLMKKWAGDYNGAKHVEVDYTSSGSGNGISAMIDKKNDFGCTDAPMSDDQLQDAAGKGGDVVHVPLAMGAVVVIYNVPGIDRPLAFDGDVLARIFMGQVTHWNHEALKRLNPDVHFPDNLAISVVHRGEGSGTSYIFSDYLSEASPTWKEKVGKGQQPTLWPTGQGAQKNPGVAKAVADTPGAIGYVELLYALQSKDKLRYGHVKNAAGKVIEPNLESVTAAAEGALARIPDDLRFSLVNAPGDKSYPISGTTWAVCYVKQPSADKATQLADFLRWAVSDGQKSCEELHYAKLPQGLVERASKKIDLIKGP